MSDDFESATVTRLEVSTADGESIEAELVEPKNPTAIAVVCHPHPLYGGSMDNPVVQAMVSGFSASKVAVARFNFRGVGRSTGHHAHGQAEQLDIATVADYLHQLHPKLPLALCGYSFGADISLAVDHPALGARLVVAPPLSLLALDSMVGVGDKHPKHLIVGRHDQYIDWTTANQFSEDPQSGWTVSVVEGADHFFGVGLGTISDTARHLFD